MTNILFIRYSLVLFLFYPLRRGRLKNGWKNTSPKRCVKASAIHHGLDHKWYKISILIDMFPIFLSVGLILFNNNWIQFISWVSWCKAAIAFIILALDHLRISAVPWGHSSWHLLAAFAADSVYQDISNHVC